MLKLKAQATGKSKAEAKAEDFDLRAEDLRAKDLKRQKKPELAKTTNTCLNHLNFIFTNKTC